jgi:ribonuclease P protein component
LISKQTFKKEERISSQKEIDFLFEQGISFFAFPLRVVYAEKKPFSGADVSVLISAPKKKFKQAVKRNRLKRLIREVYRLNKQALMEEVREKETGLLVAFLFVGNELISYKEMETTMLKALEKLKERLQ